MYAWLSQPGVLTRSQLGRPVWHCAVSRVPRETIIYSTPPDTFSFYRYVLTFLFIAFRHAVETMTTYVAQMLRKMSSQAIRSMKPSKEAADDFVEYCDAFFPRTNLAKKCSSWSNGNRPGARIHGHWPGSAAHLAQVRRSPR